MISDPPKETHPKNILGSTQAISVYLVNWHAIETQVIPKLGRRWAVLPIVLDPALAAIILPKRRKSARTVNQVFVDERRRVAVSPVEFPSAEQCRRQHCRIFYFIEAGVVQRIRILVLKDVKARALSGSSPIRFFLSKSSVSRACW